MLFVIGVFLQQDLVSPRPQHMFPIKSAPRHRSQCLAFTRHWVNSGCRGTSILVHIRNKGHIYLPVLNNSKVDKINEREVFYTKHQAAENGFLSGGASKVSSTISPTLEIISSTSMEVVSRQRQMVSPRREI